MTRGVAATTGTFTQEGFGATHNMGVCRMGKDPKTSVTNSYGQTHDMLRQPDYLVRERGAL